MQLSAKDIRQDLCIRYIYIYIYIYMYVLYVYVIYAIVMCVYDTVQHEIYVNVYPYTYIHIYTYVYLTMGFPDSSVYKELNPPAMQETLV